MMTKGFTEVVLWESGQRIWNSEKHSPTGGKIREATPGGKIWATDFGLGNHSRTTSGKIWEAKSVLRNLDSEHTGGKIRVATPGYGFWTRKTTHPRGAKSEGQNPKGKIPAAYFGLGKPGQNLGRAKSQVQIWNSEKQSPTLKRKRCLENKNLFLCSGPPDTVHTCSPFLSPPTLPIHTPRATSHFLRTRLISPYLDAQNLHLKAKV